ncbi:hypothetical protein [Phenylobacterium sp.]|uniref:hypothetical protein n=1 Tax=Phenylobacterium sp. TaxID=1871053 RepID=UPI00301CEDD9
MPPAARTATARPHALTPADIVRQHHAAQNAAQDAAQDAERARAQARVAIAAGVLTLGSALASVVWMLATLNANVASLREQLPVGAIARIETSLVDIDRRLTALEQSK